MNESAEKEPTMEEILSSIRRIISEDDEDSPAQEAAPEPAAPEAAPEPEAPAGDDVLELTDAVGDEDAEPGFVPEESMEADDILVLDDDEDMQPAAEAAPAPEPEIAAADIGEASEPAVEAAAIGEPAPEPSISSADAVDWGVGASGGASDNIVSDEAAAAAASAFTKLARTTRVPEGVDDKSLEAIVREMLRPMLKEWLDANLPGIVEKKVEQEVRRLASRD